MRGLVGLVLLAGCGRVGFDPASGDARAGSDGPGGDAGDQSWWDPAWSRRIRLSFDTAGLSGDLAGFTALVRLDGARIDYGAAQAAGQDLRFVDEDQTTVLAHEIEAWNSAGGSFAWFRLPVLRAATDAHAWLYYGNPTAPDGANPPAVWPEYAVVWHLGEDPTGPGAPIRDSTANANHGTVFGTIPAAAQVAGKVGGSLAFDGSDDWLSAAATPSLLLVGDLTILLWARRQDTDERWLCDFSGPDSEQEGNNHLYEAALDPDSTLVLGWEFAGGNDEEVATSNPAVGVGAWSLVAITRDAVSLQGAFYENGVPIGAPVTYADNATGGGTGMLWLAGEPSTTTSKLPFLGTLDEFRLVDVVRTPEWLTTEYRSMVDTLITFGPEEQL